MFDFAKVKKWRNPRYLKHVDSFPCSVCGKKDDTITHHHFGSDGKGIGTKCDDHLTVPVCFTCHDDIHNGRYHPLPWVFKEVALKIVGDWLKKVKK